MKKSVGQTSGVIGLTNAASLLQDLIRLPDEEFQVVFLHAFSVPIQQETVQDDESFGELQGCETIHPTFVILGV